MQSKMFSSFLVSCAFVSFVRCVERTEMSFAGAAGVCKEEMGSEATEKSFEKCLAYIPSYTFNQSSGQCEFFIYNGCGGSANRFRTEEECEETCEDNTCELPIAEGACRAIIPRWGYNKTSCQCEEFEYGGCGGNSNNFRTEEECENQCEDVCNKTIEKGICYSAFERYAYNKTSGQCEWFIYGGCLGNGNNFNIEKDCEDMCEAGCDKPIVTGPCLENIERYAFNKTSGCCHKFTYGGCEGNGNNYETLDECVEECEV